MAPIFIPMMAKQFEAEYDEFMAMSPEEQRTASSTSGSTRCKRAAAQAAGRRPGRPAAAGRTWIPRRWPRFRKKMLDWTTPEQRGKFENGMQMFNDRMKERGMDAAANAGRRVFLISVERANARRA